jgi:hypothetical protein
MGAQQRSQSLHLASHHIEQFVVGIGSGGRVNQAP